MRSLSAALLAALLLTPTLSLAQETVGADDERTIAVPPLGVPIEPHRGFFADFSLGTMFTVGGGGVSDAQPYLALGAGYDLTDNIALGALFGFGSSAGVCYVNVCDQSPDAGGLGAESFSILLANAFANYLFALRPHWFLGVKVTGGLALMTPEPSVTPGTDPSGLMMGFNGGALASTELHTYLNHFVIGLDVGSQFVIGDGVSFPAIQIAARFKYVF